MSAVVSPKCCPGCGVPTPRGGRCAPCEKERIRAYVRAYSQARSRGGIYRAPRKPCRDCGKETPRGGRCSECRIEHDKRRKAAEYRRRVGGARTEEVNRSCIQCGEDTERGCLRCHVCTCIHTLGWDEPVPRDPEVERRLAIALLYYETSVKSPPEPDPDVGAVTFDELVEILGPMSLLEIGAALGFSHERARHLLERAFQKIRRVPEIADLVGDDRETAWEALEREAWG